MLILFDNILMHSGEVVHCPEFWHFIFLVISPSKYLNNAEQWNVIVEPTLKLGDGGVSITELGGIDMMPEHETSVLLQ